jgi:subtilisin-like proprotein convertase family protein
MKKITAIAITIAIAFAGCESGMAGWLNEEDGPNPFLEGKEDSAGKEDTGYLNPRGKEVHVTLESDISASGWQIYQAPPEQAQFAVTFLRDRQSLYLEILAESATAPGRVEWLVDGAWLTAEQAGSVDRSKLTHWRMREVNLVLLNRQADSIAAGQAFQATVPLNPYTVYSDARDTCADPDSHISLDQSVYWYLWNPTKSGCTIALATMTLTVEQVLPVDPVSYPEYDRLWADGRLQAVVVFGKLDDGDVARDTNWGNVTKLATWLVQAGFAEEATAPLGRRFSKQVGERTEVVDIYGPDLFYSVADYAHLANWQKAVSEHEIVMYNGHSVLGTGMAFERIQYPETYQIFQVASCLSYEYYVNPVLAGKGDWDSVDVLANVEPTYYHENLPLTSTVLAKIMWGFENEGRMSWQDIMEAVSLKLGHYTFGVSGARGNCFSPEGSLCEPGPGPDPDTLRYETAAAAPIPDNNPAGIDSTISVPDSATVGGLSVELDITHTYAGDVMVVLSHNGAEQVLWNREGGSADDIRKTLAVSAFNGADASGTWTLKVSDRASRDTGTLNRWALVVTTGGTPAPDRIRHENTAATAIPDNNATGITSVIEVPEQVTVGALTIDVAVAHTYIGDLKVVLSHDGTEVVLWNKEGGGAANLSRSFTPADFNGKAAAGTWTLKVSDLAARDTGTLTSWAVSIAPAN